MQGASAGSASARYGSARDGDEEENEELNEAKQSGDFSHPVEAGNGVGFLQSYYVVVVVYVLR